HDQRIVARELGCPQRALRRFLVARDRRRARFGEALGPDLDATARGREAARAVLLERRLRRDADAVRQLPQTVPRQTRRREDLVVATRDVALRELAAEPEARGEVEDDVDVAAALVERCRRGDAALRDAVVDRE